MTFSSASHNWDDSPDDPLDLLDFDLEDGSNPYGMNPDDVISGTKQSHTLDGTPCPRCGDGTIHSVIGVDADSDDFSIKSQINHLLDQLPPELSTHLSMIARQSPSEFDPELAFSQINQSMQKMLEVDSRFAITHALAEEVDILTNGSLSRRYKVISCEHKVIMAHSVIKLFEAFVGHLQTCDRHHPSQHKAAEQQLEIARAMLEASVADYKETCNETGWQPDEGSILVGKPERELSEFAKTITGISIPVETLDLLLRLIT